MALRWTNACVLLLALVSLGATTARSVNAQEDARPPVFADAKKLISTRVKDWYVDVFGRLFISDRGARRIVRYLEGLPGDIRLQVYKLRGDPKPPPEEVHAFYGAWAGREGYRLLVSVRFGQPDPDPWLDDRDRPRQPPKRLTALQRKLLDEDYTWVDAYHRPGHDGGVFVTVWTSGKLVYVWKPGHIPVAPVLGEWLGLPGVGTDMTPPESVEPWYELPGLPAVGETAFFVRAEVGRWELESVTRDLAARTQVRAPKSPLEAFFSVSPDVLGAVRHAWVYSFRTEPEDREQVAEPWIAWAEGRGFMKLAEGNFGGTPVRAWYRGGDDGGALVVFHVEDTANVLVVDGGPNVLALLPVLGKLVQPVQ